MPIKTDRTLRTSRDAHATLESARQHLSVASMRQMIIVIAAFLSDPDNIEKLARYAPDTQS